MDPTSDEFILLPPNCDAASQHCDAAGQHCDAASQHCDTASQHCDAASQHCDSLCKDILKSLALTLLPVFWRRLVALLLLLLEPDLPPWNRFCGSGVDVMITILCDFCNFFLKNQCYDQNFAKTSISLRKNANIFAKFFGENILKIITSVPVSAVICGQNSTRD
jgi:hypothetical protein